MYIHGALIKYNTKRNLLCFYKIENLRVVYINNLKIYKQKKKIQFPISNTMWIPNSQYTYTHHFNIYIKYVDYTRNVSYTIGLLLVCLSKNIQFNVFFI